MTRPTEPFVLRFLNLSHACSLGAASGLAVVCAMALASDDFQHRLLFHLFSSSVFWLLPVSPSLPALTRNKSSARGSFEENWQIIPEPRWACSFRPQNTLTVSILDVITDASILSIPVPMLWKLKVPWKKKVIIAAILSSGLFVIAAAIIRARVTLGSAPSGDNINRWGIPETMLGVLTVNIPILKPLFTMAFWRPGPYNPHSTTTSTTSRSKSKTAWKGTRLATDDAEHNDIEMGDCHKQACHVGVLSPTSSQERIISLNTQRGDNDVLIVQTFALDHHPMNSAEIKRFSPT